MGKTTYEVYLDERKSLINTELEQARHFDKYILTLAAGTFGLSLLFMNQIDTHHGLAREAVASYNAASALEWFRGSRAAT